MVVLDGPSLTANMPCAGSSRPRACEIAGDRDRDLPAVGSEWLIQDQAFLIQMVQQQSQLRYRCELWEVPLTMVSPGFHGRWPRDVLPPPAPLRPLGAYRAAPLA